MGYTDLSMGDLSMGDLFSGSSVSSVPDVNLGTVDLGQSGSLFTPSTPDTSGGGGAGIDWTGLATKYGPAAWAIAKGAWNTSSLGKAWASTPPTLDTSTPVKEPSKMGYPVTRITRQQMVRAQGATGDTWPIRAKMNPLNPKALNRAIRRVERFEMFAKRVLKITQPTKHVAGIKRRHHKRKRCF